MGIDIMIFPAYMWTDHFKKQQSQTASYNAVYLPIQLLWSHASDMHDYLPPMCHDFY